MQLRPQVAEKHVSRLGVSASRGGGLIADIGFRESIVTMHGHIASLTTVRMHLGFVRRVGEENGKIAIVADFTEPDLVSWIEKNFEEGQPMRSRRSWLTTSKLVR